jgi:hypothetical protein
MRHLIEKIKEFNLEMPFVDYEKPSDNVKKQNLFNILKEKNIL